MKFKVVDIFSVSQMTGHDTVYLRHLPWDDWFSYATLFEVMYLDKEGNRHSIGETKIGRFGLKPAKKATETHAGYRDPQIPPTFRSLPDEYFSLGQDPSYYENLTKIGAGFRERALRALRDIAYDGELLELAELEDVTGVSLLRSVPLPTVRDQFARLAVGGARLTSYRFAFVIPQEADPLTLQFMVDPAQTPPTNIQVLIGRNGVGKSTLLNRLARHLVRSSTTEPAADTGKTTAADQLTNLVSVSFSAFDQFEPITVPRDRTRGLTYHYVGLKKIGARNDEPTTTKDPKALTSEMTRSARTCLVGARRQRWVRALRLLEADPIFSDTGISDLIDDGAVDDPDLSSDESVLEEISSTFAGLSSGHKIVLLTITRLVETVEEKSLVLLDEPEAHLHPPLLSALVRALSDLLTNRNGVAIIATHSPVVLQEVPQSCVWKLHRSGKHLSAERPQLETFGENVGILTEDVFGLEVTATGFHRMLAEAAYRYRDYDRALSEFSGNVGAEGRAILRAMVNAVASSDSHVGG